jgi:aspartyl-tRNA(Asn)/glutamyl-tRNA(Gln) amidotransferase subunit B
MEEDAGKNIHSAATSESFVDLNRTGTPLLEIVSYPDISSAHEARAYLKLLRNIVLHLGVGTGNMEDGALRADTNISVRKKGQTQLGTKVELKNINSFKFIADAIEYEIKRQIDAIESSNRIIQETRSWDTQGKQTVAMRSKEEAADYRYFPEPDLPPVYLEQHYIDTIKSQLPELPDKKYERYSALGLTPDQATILIDDMALAHYFDATYALHASPNLINWVLRDVIGYLKENKLELAQFTLTPTHLAELMTLIDTGVINVKVAQDVFKQSAQTGTSPHTLVKEQKLEQIGNEQELELVVKHILEQNSQQVIAYKNGNQKLFGFFVG